MGLSRWAPWRGPTCKRSRAKPPGASPGLLCCRHRSPGSDCNQCKRAGRWHAACWLCRRGVGPCMWLAGRCPLLAERPVPSLPLAAQQTIPSLPAAAPEPCSGSEHAEQSVGPAHQRHARVARLGLQPGAQERARRNGRGSRPQQPFAWAPGAAGGTPGPVQAGAAPRRNLPCCHRRRRLCACPTHFGLLRRPLCPTPRWAACLLPVQLQAAAQAANVGLTIQRLPSRALLAGRRHGRRRRGARPPAGRLHLRFYCAAEQRPLRLAGAGRLPSCAARGSAAGQQGPRCSAGPRRCPRARPVPRAAYHKLRATATHRLFCRYGCRRRQRTAARSCTRRCR